MAGPAGEGAGEGGPQIGALRIRDGKVHAAIAGLKADFNVDTQTEDPSGEGAGEGPALLADAEGTYAAQPIAAKFRGGAVLNLRDAERPWPIDLQLSNGPTRVSLKGTVRDPVNLAGADLRLEVQTPDMARLSALTGVPIPATPPFRATGRLDYTPGPLPLHRCRGTGRQQRRRRRLHRLHRGPHRLYRRPALEAGRPGRSRRCHRRHPGAADDTAEIGQVDPLRVQVDRPAWCGPRWRR